MGDISSEPSMEEILSSIKKIIAEDSVKALSGRVRPGSRGAVPTKDVVPSDNNVVEAQVESAAENSVEDDSIFELTEDAIRDDAELVSDAAILESRNALSSLAKPSVKAEPESGNALEAMVRDMLRPMLKDWLDANLADIVRSAVEREVARIADRNN
jgi:uncharacterized protein